MARALISRSRLLALLVVAAVLPGTSGAQIAGLPVHFSPSAETGLRLFGDFAFGDDPVRTYGGGRALLNLSYVSVGLMGGNRGDADFAWGANLALNLIRGSKRSHSLSVEGGFGDNRVVTDGLVVDSRDVTIGVGGALERDRPGVVLEPWAGLRAHIRRSESGNRDPVTKVGVGLSAGLNLSSGALAKLGIPLPGFGAHVSADYLNIARPFGEGAAGALLLNLGLNYLFPIAGLPSDGIVPVTCDPTDPTC
ncbi:MAG TPA: hypothetical protein VEB59_13905 [Gemmatimonadales bacterium]|nr:hypothetical protein [Gemmatimonadales bacterium]